MTSRRMAAGVRAHWLDGLWILRE